MWTSVPSVSTDQKMTDFSKEYFSKWLSRPTYPREFTWIIQLIHILIPKQRSRWYCNQRNLAEGARHRPIAELCLWLNATHIQAQLCVSLRQGPAAPYSRDNRDYVGEWGWPISGHVDDATSSSGMPVGTGNTNCFLSHSMPARQKQSQWQNSQK